MDWFDDVFGDLDLTMLHSGEKHRVFVYGTLMTGMRNHFRLDSNGAKLINTLATTCGDFTMFTRTTSAGYNAPIVVPNRGQPARRIGGQIYEISNELLITLDRLEGHPYVYRRESVLVGYNPSEDEWASEYMWMYSYVGELSDPPSTDGILFHPVNEQQIILCRWVGA
jgi:gamma-glutamylcyclotransferase (GGCT)/AIG2-like uncharacterized protein YtfP